MRSLSANMTADQAAGSWYGVRGIYQIVCNAVTYDETRILHILHVEEATSQKATIVLDNADGTLSTLDVKGLQVDLSYGVEFGPLDNSRSFAGGQCAPMWVTEQRIDNYNGVVILECEGLLDRLKRDESSAAFTPDAADPTVNLTYLKDILISATTLHPVWQASHDYGEAWVTPTVPNGWYYYWAGGIGTLSGTAEPTWPMTIGVTVADSAVTWTTLGKSASIFSHTFANTVTVDSAETLLTTLTPRTGFNVTLRESRFDAVQDLLEPLASVVRAESSGIHIILPTVAGTAYDYVYDNSSDTTHTYAMKEASSTLTAPNYVTVASLIGAGTVYSATAANTADNAILNIRTFRNFYVSGTAQASSIATAVMTKINMESNKGRIVTSMNIGQEVFDYVNVIDSAGNNIVGNVSQIIRVAAPGIYQQELRFGDSYRVLPSIPREVKDYPSFMSWFKTVMVNRLNNELEPTL